MPYVLTAVVLIWTVLMPRHFRYREQKAKCVFFKTLSTVLCAAFAAVACSRPGADAAAWLIFVGLCVCAAADAMLEYRFEIGGALFSLGHVLYVAAFSTLRTPSWLAGGLFVPIFGGLCFFLSRYRARINDARLFAGLSIYAAALAALLAAAVSAAILAFSERTLTAALGAALFVLSDLTLCRNTVEERGEKSSFLSLGIYYMGQLCLAVAAFVG